MTDYLHIKQLSELKSISGCTSLITMFLRENDVNSINLALNKLNYEMGTASNIKS